MQKIQMMTRFYQSPILAAGLASAGKLQCAIAARRAHIKAAIHGGTSRFTPVDLPQYHAAIAMEYAAGIAAYDRYSHEARRTLGIGMESGQLEQGQNVDVTRQLLVNLFHKETIRASIAHVHEVNPHPTGAISELFNRSIDSYGSWEIFPHADSLHCERIEWSEPVEKYLQTYVATADQLHSQPYPGSATGEFEAFRRMCTADEIRCTYYHASYDGPIGISFPPWTVNMRLVYYLDHDGNDCGVPLGAVVDDPTYTPRVRTELINFYTHCIERYTWHPFTVTNWKKGSEGGEFSAMKTIMRVER